MGEAELASAVYTVNGWRARRIAKGKSVDARTTESYIRTAWPDLSDSDIAEILLKGNF